VRAVERTREIIIDKLKSVQADIDREYGIELFGLVGSWARGDARPDSDIDIVYRLDKSRNVSLFDLGGVWSELNEEFGCHIDLIDWRCLKPHHKELMEKDLIEFYG